MDTAKVAYSYCRVAESPGLLSRIAFHEDLRHTVVRQFPDLGL